MVNDILRHRGSNEVLKYLGGGISGMLELTDFPIQVKVTISH